MSDKTYIIAEIGVNHNGSIDLAKEMIDLAVESGVDAVKFQTFIAEELVVKSAKKAEYQQKTTASDESQLEMLKKLQLSRDDHIVLLNYCKQKDLQFLSTPFDITNLDYLISLGLPVVKIPSGEITNLPYLRAVNRYGKNVILSTGMSTLDEVAAAIRVLDNCGITLLHCTTEYPCPFDAVNLRAMLTMKESFRLPVGYSDHTNGIEVPIAAVALGATVIEKHFTLDRNLPGPDHKASLEPNELKAMVLAIRNIEQAMGDGIKKPAIAEIKNIAVARKSIVAKQNILKGEIFSEDNIAVKRPGTGISPMKWDEIIGSAAMRDYRKDELI